MSLPVLHSRSLLWSCSYNREEKSFVAFCGGIVPCVEDIADGPQDQIPRHTSQLLSFVDSTADSTSTWFKNLRSSRRTLIYGEFTLIDVIQVSWYQAAYNDKPFYSTLMAASLGPFCQQLRFHGGQSYVWSGLIFSRGRAKSMKCSGGIAVFRSYSHTTRSSWSWLLIDVFISPSKMWLRSIHRDSQHSVTFDEVIIGRQTSAVLRWLHKKDDRE